MTNISVAQVVSGTAATGTSLALDDISTTEGNTLVVLIFGGDATTVTGITDSSATNSWEFSTSPSSQNPPFAQTVDGNWFTGAVWCDDAASITSVSVELDVSEYGWITLIELENAGLLDTAVSYQAGTGATEGPGGATATTGEFIVATAIGGDFPVAGSSGGWTPITSNGRTFASYLIAGSAGTYTPPFTNDVQSCGCFVAFTVAGQSTQVEPHVFPMAALAIAQGEIDLATELSVLLISAESIPYSWNTTSQSAQFVSDVLGGSGAGALTEVSTTNTGYDRQGLSGLTGQISGLTMEILMAPVIWENVSFTAAYAVFYENEHSTDATRRVVAYWDFSGQANPASNATFTLQPSGGVFLYTPFGS